MTEPTNDMSIGDISVLTLEAVIQAVVICIAGFWAARSGMLNRTGQKVISQLNVNVFTPCLVFAKIASQLSISALIDISIIPIIFVLSVGISYACGHFCSRQFGFNKRESNFVIAMAVFGNSNSVPVSLFLNLAASLPALRWPDIPGDNSENVASRGLVYLLIFQQLGQILRWSWGYNTLLAPESLPETVNDNSYIEPNLEDEETVSLRKESLWEIFLKDLRSFMNPPLWSMLAAIIVASVPILKDALYGTDGFFNQTLGVGIQQIGDTAVPLILVVLGANLAPPDANEAHMLEKSPRYGQLIFASLISRMILPAIVLLPMIALSVRYLGISILDDPAFLVVCFVLTASPPAVQLSQICQLNEVFEAEMSGVLFWGYVVLALPSSILIVIVALEVLNWSELSISGAIGSLPAVVQTVLSRAR